MNLSVIIPVYKVEKTLNRCVESVLCQDVVQMEVILVDDGSPDGCGMMCDTWASRDERVRVVHKENGGLSSARNAGIDIAKGRYITFVDSDDYLLPDTYTNLMRSIEKYESDILEFGIVQESSSRMSLRLEERLFTSAKQYWTATCGWSHSYACNKIFRLELFHNIRFDEGHIFEDLLLMPRLLKQNPKVATTNTKAYVYSDNGESISTRNSAKTSYSLFSAELKAAIRMRTMPWGKGRNLYYMMLCRLFDIIRLSL